MVKPAAELRRIRAKLERSAPNGEWDGPAYASSIGRRAATLNDPLAFALVYLERHLRDAQGKVTLSTVHVAWAESAKLWSQTSTTPMSDRRAEVAPREMGKSTWHFLLLPMWGAAHGHVKFAAAFANTGPQAETHLASFKSELDNNALLRLDFPELVRPKTRGRGTVEADRVSLYHAASGFVFAAAGMDSANLGMKVGNLRPDLIVLDDIEPHEGMYSAALATKRLDTLRAAILPLNVYAHVILVGTVTMVDSIVHQIVKRNRGEANDLNGWVEEEAITARHFAPFVVKRDGARRSIWPEKWPTSWLEGIEGSRTFAKNYANDPIGADGDYWTMEDFTRGELTGVTRVLLEIDPAVTTKKSSDYTALAVIGWSPSEKKVVVLEVLQVKLPGSKLRLLVLKLIEKHGVGFVRIESNQGGETWLEILWGLPVKVKTVHETAPKEVRAADALQHYQRGRVVHSDKAKLADLEGQMVAFPNAPHDDMVDAAGAGIRYFLNPKKPTRQAVGGETMAYA